MCGQHRVQCEVWSIASTWCVLLFAVSLTSDKVDISRRSPTYENRLIKYQKRGFLIGVVGLDVTKIDVDRVSGVFESGEYHRWGVCDAVS